MDPTHCTIVILNQVKPYIIENDQEQLFSDYFGQVYTKDNLKESIETIEQCSADQPTLMLLDLDAVKRDEQTNDSLKETMMYHDLMLFITQIIRDLSCLPNNVPLVVCSTNDDAHIMLDCIHAGATDYLLKPIHPNVMKTLFLRIHTCQLNSKQRDREQKSLPALVSNTMPKTLNDRINEMTCKNLLKKNAISEIYDSLLLSPKSYSNIPKERSAELKRKVCSWDFSPFGLTEQDLIHCVFLMFDQVLKLPELYHISITQDQLYDFIIDLAGVYHDENPYHNFAHAVDVLQCLFYMLCELGVLPFTNKFQQHKNKPQSLLRPKDVFALLIAAIGHDAAHPGVNNLFLINSANPLATLYNDKSILESLHSMTLFQLLHKHGIDTLVGNLNSVAYKDFRKTVVTSILATDMSLHHEYVTKIKNQAARFSDPNLKLDQDEERLILCSALIKCADISNVARPFHWGIQWAELLVKEFVSQGDLEKELGLPVLPMNDRTQVVVEDSQIGFIQAVALDLFKNVSQVLYELEFAVNQMQSNLEQWKLQKRMRTEYIQEEEDDDDDEIEVISNSSATHMMMVETGTNKRSNNNSLDEQCTKKRLSTEKYLTNQELNDYIAYESNNNNNNNRNRANNSVYCHCSIQ